MGNAPVPHSLHSFAPSKRHGIIQLLRRRYACTPVCDHAPVASVEGCLPLPPRPPLTAPAAHHLESAPQC